MNNNSKDKIVDKKGDEQIDEQDKPLSRKRGGGFHLRFDSIRGAFEPGSTFSFMTLPTGKVYP